MVFLCSIVRSCEVCYEVCMRGRKQFKLDYQDILTYVFLALYCETNAKDIPVSQRQFHCLILRVGLEVLSFLGLLFALVPDCLYLFLGHSYFELCRFSYPIYSLFNSLALYCNYFGNHHQRYLY